MGYAHNRIGGGRQGNCCSLVNHLHKVMVMGCPLGDPFGSVRSHGYVAIISPHWENNLVPKVVRITQGVPILPCGILKIQFCPLHQDQLGRD